MPYIDPINRDEVDTVIDELRRIISATPTNSAAGVMNYIISRIVSVNIQIHDTYSEINEAIGVLECVKNGLELYKRLRRRVVPHDDSAMET